MSAIPNKRVSDWRLDQDFFDLGSGTALVVAQGSSIAVDALERLSASGVSEVVRVGTCGGLSEAATLGAAVLARAAVRLEGTSGHYLPSYFPAISSASLDDRVSQILRGIGVNAVYGTVATTDGRWRESRELLAQLKASDVVAIDMETSALFVAASSLSVRASSVMFCADSDLSHHVNGRDVRLDSGLDVEIDEAGWHMLCETIRRVVELIADEWREVHNGEV